MQFLINDTQVKTVISGATIQGSLDNVSRSASFSYIYNPDDSNFAVYKAKTGASVTIKNNDGENIFKGNIHTINYHANKHLVEIQAQDYLSLLLKNIVTGRFKGTFSSILSNALCGFDLGFDLDSVLAQEINIINLGSLSLYDVISIAAYKLYGDEFKIYLDGNSKLKILLPLIGNSKGDFVIGQNILSCFFSGTSSENKASIKAIGNDDVVSGTIIRLIDSDAGINGYFTVVKDKHTYTGVHTMELELKERVFS